MNLAYRDIRHNLLRFFLTCIGLGLLLGIVVAMMGIYRGSLDDALRLVRAARPDLWVVEANTNGPFAESSRISGDTREMVARVYGIKRAGSVTYQSVQTMVRSRPLRLFVIGYELDRPGGPQKLVAGRNIIRSHYEMVADRSAGLGLDEQVPLGTHGHMFTVVGLTQGQVTAAGDPAVYITLLDAQQLQFEEAPPIERREAARAGPSPGNDIINAVVATVSPYVSIKDVVAAIGRWKHLAVLTQEQQETVMTKFVIEKQRKQLGMFMVLLMIVSAVIIALIIYTLTMDKLRSIATLKLVGAPDRVIVGLIVQQALAMGIVGFLFGLTLVMTFKDYFPRRVLVLPTDVLILFGIAVTVCLLASALGVRAAVRVDPSQALVG
jgi:putative ABC transport system permease protein